MKDTRWIQETVATLHLLYVALTSHSSRSHSRDLVSVYFFVSFFVCADTLDVFSSLQTLNLSDNLIAAKGVRICLYQCVCIYVDVWRYVSVYVYVCRCVYVYLSACVCVLVCMCE